MIVDAQVSIYFAGRAWGTAELGYIHSLYVALLAGRERFDHWLSLIPSCKR